MPTAKVRAGERLLFVGDSNTDTEYRTRFPPHGYGYVMFVATMLAARDPELRLDVVNRGNDGDTVVDLARRWQHDVIDARPDHVFVLIGTNDVAYRYTPADGHRAVGDDAFARTLAELVAATRARTAATVTLIEPMPYEIPPHVDAEPNRALERLCGRVPRAAGAAIVDRTDKHRGEPADVRRLLRDRHDLEVTFVGRTMPRREFTTLFREHDVYLHLSHPEGFPISILEAFGAGCLVVGFAGHGGLEFMRDRDNCCVAPDGDVHAVVAALHHALELPREALDAVLGRALATARAYPEQRTGRALANAFAAPTVATRA